LTTDDLEELLEATSERQSLDFKRSCPWDARTFAKDVLALCNVEDGGRLVIGVEDGTLKRVGVSEEDLKTYSVDTMRDQIAPYADPHVNFDVEHPVDREGRRYVVITVRPFEEVPVICRKGGPDTRVGAIYYRNRNRRVESAEVSNAADMRAIIEVAAIRMRRRWRQLGLSMPDNTSQRLDDELQGL
jgi:predicted HTH transcriptional regulator